MQAPPPDMRPVEYAPAGYQPRHMAAAQDDPPPAGGAGPTGEPVVIAHAVTVILGALVTAGWVAIPNTIIDAVGTILALVLSTVGVVLARARVSPLQGGMWAAVEGYVVDLVADELDKHRI